MKRKSKVCRILAAAGSEEGIRSIKNILRDLQGPAAFQVSQALTIAQVRQRVSPYAGGEPVDIAILKLPLQDGPGIEQILDMAGKNTRLQILLMARREAYDQIVYRSRDMGVFVMSFPVNVQVMTEALRYMLTMHKAMSESDEEVMRLRKRLSEIGYITRAKCILIADKGMDEEEAHYYLERSAMDRCISKKEAALEIIREKEERAGA